MQITRFIILLTLMSSILNPEHGPAGILACGGTIINEVDYDQPGTDSQEFIELYGPPDSSLAEYELRLINGLTGTIYATQPLTGTMPADGYFVIGSLAVANHDLTLGSGADNLIQNGAPDGFGLWDTSTDGLCDFVNYEGFIPGFEAWPDIGEDGPDTCTTGASTSLSRRETTLPPNEWVSDTCATPGTSNQGPTALHLTRFSGRASITTLPYPLLIAILTFVMVIAIPRLLKSIKDYS